MTIFRASLLALLLVGCATTSKYSTEDKYGHKCQYIKGALVPFITVNSNESTDNTTYFYDLNSKKTFSGFDSIHLKDSQLEIRLIDKSLFEQYTAPILHNINNNTYEASPILAMLGTAMSAGIIWVAAPREYANFAFGCTEKIFVEKRNDETNKLKTGKTEWRDSKNSHRILISGFDKDYERSSSFGQAEYDLSPYILRTDFTKATAIKITCLDCDLLGQEEQALYKDAKKSIEITADFRAIKADLIVEAEKKKVAQVKHDKGWTPPTYRHQGAKLI